MQSDSFSMNNSKHTRIHTLSSKYLFSSTWKEQNGSTETRCSAAKDEAVVGALWCLQIVRFQQLYKFTARHTVDLIYLGTTSSFRCVNCMMYDDIGYDVRIKRHQHRYSGQQ